MNASLLIAVILLAAANVILLLIIVKRSSGGESARLEHLLREEFRLGREESARSARELREEMAANQRSSSDTVVNTMKALGNSQNGQLETVTSQIREMTNSNELRLEGLRSTVDEQMKNLQQNNEKKLEQMRATVDEKLQSTLEKRLGESFKLVSERLEAVQRGLGEMQSLANGVGDLKRVLTNVKTRGTWGEFHLGAILEQILTPDQYAENVQTKEGSGERVEFAIKLPGRAEDNDSIVWLPIDAKFPQEDYQRLCDASEAADAEAVKKAQESLVRSVEASAREIHDKYLNPPFTTDFAIMYLPTEGLYAEVYRHPGMIEKLQHQLRVTVAGPSTLAAFLNSLRMGFRTLAIEKRSSEVWQILAAVKTEFDKFGNVLVKVKRQLASASNTIEETERRTRAMARKLKDVEQLPEDTAEEILSLPEKDHLLGVHAEEL